LRARRSTVTDSALPYLLSVPQGGADRPLLVFLHGYDEGSPTSLLDGATRHGPLSRSADLAVEPGHDFIILAPQLPHCGDSWLRHARDVRAVIEEVLERHPADRSRVYVTGFSFGGNGVLDLAPRLTDCAAALWAVDPTRVPSLDTALPLWLSAGQLTRRQEHSFVRALQLRSVEDASAADRIYVDEGHDHVGTATSAYSDRRIYDWLLARRRSE
jgi:predicted peptidase